MTLNMKAKRRVFLLWFALYANWILVQGVHFGKDHQRLRFKPSVKRRVYEPNHYVRSESSKGSSNQTPLSRLANDSLSNIKNFKRFFIQRRIQLKGAPKGVIVNVNGQKIFSSAGASALPQPGPGVVGPNKAINLHINLNKKPYESSRPQRKQQPIIIAAPRPQQAMRPIVISVPTQTQPPQPVVMPAPLPPPVVMPAPLPPPVVMPAPLPQPAPLPPVVLPAPIQQPVPAPDKEENDLGNILQTVALLNSLGKKEESPPKVVPVPVPVPVPAYPAGGPYQGYQAGGNQGYPSQKYGYPAGGNPNQGYPAGGGTNQGYPAGENPNQGYPAGGGPNQGYPAGGGPNQGYPAGTPLGAPPTAGNGGTKGATNPLAALSGILPLLLPMNCRCGCERRCPDLCGLCKDVDEEIYDSIDCCKPVPCQCSNAGALGTTQPVQQGSAVAVPQQGTGVPMPQNPQASTLPAAVPNPAQAQPLPMASPPLQLSAPGQTQPLLAPPIPPLTQLNPGLPSQPVPPLPQLPPLPSVPQVSPTGPITAPGQLPLLPPKPEIAPPKAEVAPPKPEVAPPKPEVTPPKPEIPTPALPGSTPGSITPPKPEIVPTTTNPTSKEGSLPLLPPGPEGPGGPGETIPPPPENEGSIKIPPISVLPGETSIPPPPLPSLPLSKPAYPVPPPAPQVFIIKENKDSPKDPEDRKSAEALDNLSQTFEDAFTEAYKSEKKKGRRRYKPRRERFRQRLQEQDSSDSDSEEPHRGRIRQRLHDQDDSDSGSDLDLEEEVVKDFEKEEDEERMQSSVGSRREFTEHNTTDDNDDNEDNDSNNDNEISDNADDNIDTNDDDNHDHNDNDDDDDNKNMDVNQETEPSYDADEPRQSHSHSQAYHDEYRHRELKRHRSRKKNSYLRYQDYGKSTRPDEDNREQHPLSLAKSNRFLEHQKMRSRTNWKKHKALKNLDEQEMPRKYFAIRDENINKNPSKNTLHSRTYHKGRRKLVKNLKHRVKSHYYSKENVKVPVSHDTSNFAHLQEHDSDKSHRKHARHHAHHHEQLNHHQYNHQHGNQYNQHGLQYNQHGLQYSQHGLQYSQQHDHHYSHSNTGTMIPEDAISEASASVEGSVNSDYESSASFKLEDETSFSNNGEGNNHLPEKNSDVNKELKALLSTVQSFKPRAHHKLLKHKNLKKGKNTIEDDNYSSGEESGESEISE